MNVFSGGPQRQQANFGRNVSHPPPNFNTPPPRQPISYAESDMFAPNSEQRHHVNISSHQQFHSMENPPQQQGTHSQNKRNQNSQWDKAFQSQNHMIFSGNFTGNNAAGGVTAQHHSQSGNQYQNQNGNQYHNQNGNQYGNQNGNQYCNQNGNQYHNQNGNQYHNQSRNQYQNQSGNQRKPWNNNVWNNLPKAANRHQEHVHKKVGHL
jgi:hypothetical protein